MSIEPEVPYDVDFDTLEEEENWRDPQILADENAIRRQREFGGDIGDYDYSEPLQSQDQQPDDCWMLPPEYTLQEVLGLKKAKLEEIRNETATSLKYNESKHQVDIWGARDSVNRAKALLELIVQRLHTQKAATQRKSKKWGKPERELTEKERRRADRKQAQQAEARSYMGYPTVPQPYNALVPLPDKSISAPELFGAREEFLNRVRVECKSYIYYNAQMNIINIAGEDEDAVKQAAMRMRNLYLYNARSPSSKILRQLKQPSTNMMVQFRRLPQGFVTQRYLQPAQEQLSLGKDRLLEGVLTGVVDRITERENLIDLDDDPRPEEDNTTGLSEEMQNLDRENMKKAQDALELGLESIRLVRWEIKLKIRLGQIVVVSYPRRDNAMTLEEIAYKFFPNRKFESELAPCIGKDMENLKPLFEWLSSKCIQYADSPRTTYTIDAEQYPQFVEKPTPYSRREQQSASMDKEDRWRTTIIAHFTGERRVGLWRCLTEFRDIVTISNADLENDYSWELKLQTAVRMNSDSYDTPHGRFVEHLRLNQDTNRLILLPNCTDYYPQLITQKTKWVYGYGDYWDIEVARDEVWDVNRLNISPQRRDLPVDLTSHEPHRVIFKFSIYHTKWMNRFSENLSLGVGEAPAWTPVDFLRNPYDPDESMEGIINIAQKMKEILGKEVKPYYDDLNF
ncbi:hypothetical protein BJV82DRAFT_620778 [Fennellomyces sp. T-0311]|nr:hypothetical protein BJV82DRAFT_620778 [Fennellomyces sp. T-0311]